MTSPNPPFKKLYSLDASGVNVVTALSADAITSTAVTLFPGDAIELTPAVREANSDRNGKSWIDYTDEEQLYHFGRMRWGIANDVPNFVVEAANAARALKLQKERQNLLQRNPHLLKRVGAANRIDQLDAAIAELSA
jgi:hypothetical protein